MNLSVVPNHQMISDSACIGKIVVVIDVFRATSFMTAAFAHGCQSILPVSSVEQAFQYYCEGDILAGEYHAKKIPQFHHDNSPSTLHQLNLTGRRIILCTTNGTQAIQKATNANRIIIGSLLNARAVSLFLNNAKEDTLILCAGTRGRSSLEDEVAAGYILQQVMEKSGIKPSPDHEHFISQFEQVQQSGWGTLKQSESGKRLQRSGREQDLDFCIQQDIYDILPQRIKIDNQTSLQEFFVSFM